MSPGLNAPALGMVASLCATACASTGLVAQSGATLNKAADARLVGETVAVAWSGYRSGQHPDRGDGERAPSDEQILEDLRILTGQAGFRLIRLYDSGAVSARTLQLIADHALPLRVVLGAWLSAELSNEGGCAWLTGPIPEATLAANRLANVAEVNRAIALAQRHPEIVCAVNVGNEALVTWNDHLVSVDALLEYAQRVKDAISQPVTTSDNYVVFREQGPRLGTVLDFFMVHTYPVWEGKGIDEAAAYTIENLQSVRDAAPNVPIVIGEAGWPSVASEFGDRASEANQAQYIDWLCAWANENHVTTFLFEAFDEDWKGNPTDPLGAEKHWGLFSLDRTPKWVMGDRPRGFQDRVARPAGKD